jgi:hypothetical protein
MELIFICDLMRFRYLSKPSDKNKHGFVVSVPPHIRQHVKTQKRFRKVGQTLVFVEPTPEQIALAEAHSNLSSTETKKEQ